MRNADGSGGDDPEARGGDQGETAAVLEHAPRHSHQSVGEVENANKRLKGQVRCEMAKVEHHYPMDPVSGQHKLLPWAVRHSADVLTKYAKHSNGRTSWEMLRHKPYRGHVACFGESVWFKDPKKTGMDALNSQWGSGLWLGLGLCSRHRLMKRPVRPPIAAERVVVTAVRAMVEA